MAVGLDRAIMGHRVQARRARAEGQRLHHTGRQVHCGQVVFTHLVVGDLFVLDYHHRRPQPHSRFSSSQTLTSLSVLIIVDLVLINLLMSGSPLVQQLE